MNEVINYYAQNNSNIFVTFLDASKAFDRVEYVKLFRILIDKHVCPMVARFLSFVYTNQKCKVRWRHCVSDFIDISNGVKQGGVLSPILFTLYIDVLLSRLKGSNVGCHIGSHYIGSVAYADDIVLLCPSISSTKVMLDVCKDFSDEFKISFNYSKSKLIVYSDDDIKVPIVFKGACYPSSNHRKACWTFNRHCSGC